MATVLPFKGIRPKVQLAEQVAAPPYDVINREEARKIAQDNPYSFLHISKPEIDFPSDKNSHSELVYQKGRDNLDRFLDEDVFSQDKTPSFYIYRQTSGNPACNNSQAGIVGLVSADDYEADIIKKHELTRPDKEDDRTRHMQALAAQTGPVFLTYPKDNNLDVIIENCSQSEPVYDFLSDGVQHQFWTLIDDVYIQQIRACFKLIPTLFIADGHHRSAAAVRYRAIQRGLNKKHQGNESYNYFMAVLFPHDQLSILGYHRVVKDLAAFDDHTFLDSLNKDFDVTACGKDGVSDRAGRFGLYLKGQWYQLDYCASENRTDDIVASLDASILQNSILSPLLGITDIRTDARIDFIGGINSQLALEKAVDSGQYAAAFSCNPVSIEALMKIAAQDKLMPPKSTWFEPKLKSGLVIHKFD